MHTVKGFRVVQTFAMSSSSSDSGGKRSRIRRSKEERKIMVESFIKTYQRMNNGNFPSLNLTHKEVGGSFYTVREIVREIIQENRVLGPAMFPLDDDDNKTDIMQHFPVGTIAVQPLICSPLGVSDILRHEENKQYQGEKSEDVEQCCVDVKANGSYTIEHAFDHHQSVESALLSNSVEQESHQNSNAEQVLVTPSSPHQEDINRESHPSVESELLSNNVEQESHQNSNAEQVLVTPSSLQPEDINQESHLTVESELLSNSVEQESHVSVESELLSNSVEQESHQNSNAEQVLVTPSSLHPEDINQESHHSVESELLSNIVDQESHQNSNAEHVLVTPCSLHHEDINQESHLSVESELLSNIVVQESSQNSNAEQVLVTPSSLHQESLQSVESELLSNIVEQESHQNSDSEHVLVIPSSIDHEDINQESHQKTIAEQVKHPEKDHLESTQASEEKDSFREPLHIDTVVEDSLDNQQYEGEKSEHILTLNEQEIEDVKENGSDTTVHADDHHQSVESALLSDSVEQESHQNSNAEQVLVDLNQDSLQNTIAEQAKHAEMDHLGSTTQASEEKGSREPLHVDTAVEDSLVELTKESNEQNKPLPGNNTRPEVVMEIFPPQPVTQSQTINGFEGRPDKHRVPEETGNDQETKNKFENLSSEKVDGSLDEKASPSNGYASSEICETLITSETPVTDGKNVVIPEVDVLSIGKPVDTNENTSGLDNNTLHQQTTTEVATDTKIEPSFVDKDIGSSSNKRQPTLDRTKLETWEGTSEKKKPSSVKEIDSIVALFKAFLVAIVKFITK